MTITLYNTYDDFIANIKPAPCPICQERLSDDGCNSNMVFIDSENYLHEWYFKDLAYPHETVACASHHHFLVKDFKLSDHIKELDGISRGWVMYQFYGIGKDNDNIIQCR